MNTSIISSGVCRHWIIRLIRSDWKNECLGQKIFQKKCYQTNKPEKDEELSIIQIVFDYFKYSAYEVPNIYGISWSAYDSNRTVVWNAEHLISDFCIISASVCKRSIFYQKHKRFYTTGLADITVYFWFLFFKIS